MITPAGKVLPAAGRICDIILKNKRVLGTLSRCNKL